MANRLAAIARARGIRGLLVVGIGVGALLKFRGSGEDAARLLRRRYAVRGEVVNFEWTHLRLDGVLVDTEVTLNSLEIAGEEQARRVRDEPAPGRPARGVRRADRGLQCRHVFTCLVQINLGLVHGQLIRFGIDPKKLFQSSQRLTQWR